MKKHEPCFCEECEKARYNIPCGYHFHESFWKTVVESDEWRAWCEEVRKRWKKIKDKDCLPIFDIDECQECGWISPDHWREFMKFSTLTKPKKLL
jgi:hypothetical protein